ncbi:trehalose 6-phosphate phosphatase [Bradymonas sediminis]|nr:trehalose 6-phosphate phosphatase [Bradymonas sediminis]
MNPRKSAVQAIDEIFERIGSREVALFVDYDGTLTPIAPKPHLAELGDAMRQRLRALAGVCDVAVVSGRALADVRARVGLDTVAYAGSHGLEITGASRAPSGAHRPAAFEGLSLEKGRDFMPTIARVESELRLRTGRIEGALVERKPFGVGLHFRQVADQDLPTISKHLDWVLREFPGFRVTAGKKIYDIRPDIDWDKGSAVRWILTYGPNSRGQDPLAIYIGDDTTDEDAFRALRPDGVTIVVQATPSPSAAEYCLRDTGQVQDFLDALFVKLSPSVPLPDHSSRPSPSASL